MEIRSISDIKSIGQDITPPLYPISHSLYNTYLLSHCSACFSPLHLSPKPSSIPPSLSPPLYCSSLCASSDQPLHSLSGEHSLLLSHSLSDSSDLRASLRLLHRYHDRLVGDRIGGLLSNRSCLIDDPSDEVFVEIKEGAKAMAKARRMIRGNGDDDDNCVVEETALCVVITNAVEVQDVSGVAVGIAVYDTPFSWINHSCCPNACYRFSGFDDESGMLIAAAPMDGGGSGDNVLENDGWERYGPRIGVRSMKPISKGEEITIAYTDLLQTRESRQSELWSKYRFFCHCRRCSTFPLAFVDHALQDIHVTGLTSTNLYSACNVHTNEVVEILTEYMNGAISEYVKFDNAESCCEKLEHVLSFGFTNDRSPREGKLQEKIMLQPLHHLSLNAYTALSSAYKTLGSNLLDSSTNLLEHQLNAFNNSRISAAYSLLLAGATHYLFLSESSLIISVANYWTAAGESLLCLATGALHDISMDRCYPILNLPPLNLRCDNCALKDKCEASFFRRHTQNLESEHFSRDFINCITDVVPEVWMFLIQGSHYLNRIKSPIDFSWLGRRQDSEVSDSGANLGSNNVVRSLSRCEQEKWYDNQRNKIFQLGAHCLLYGELVLKVCCGKDPQLANLS
ncbi:protein SET DOMAIN GROUP 41 isoform X2 [Apium graveolens]|uniref:protein SET DOMAIN GROUP 41 isoform X2 n=1 Tax=Apium graveolens TaxID=4045 RepID=UPI003D78FF87